MTEEIAAELAQFRALVQLARRRLVIGGVDLEQAWIDLLGGVEIVDGDRGIIALRIGHRPLLELAVLGADHQHQATRADQRPLFLDGDGDEAII